MKPKTKFTTLSIIVSFLLAFLTDTGFSQSVAVNTTGTAANASAILDVSSSDKGVLIPRLSLSSLTAASPLTSPATSLLVYNTNTSITGGAGYYYNSGTPAAPVWIRLVAQTDSSVKSITPSGDVIALERFPMGEVSMNGNVTLTNISSANTWTKAAGTTVLSAGGYQFSSGGVNNRLVYTGSKHKMFHIACTISVKATNSSQNLKAVIYKNGVALTAGIVQTKMGNSSDIISTAIHVMTDMHPNDYLELWITNTVGTEDFTVTEMNLFAMGVSMGMD
jgi:hypothetical protein